MADCLIFECRLLDCFPAFLRISGGHSSNQAIESPAIHMCFLHHALIVLSDAGTMGPSITF